MTPSIRPKETSAEHIRHVAGPVSDATIAAILDIGATAEELEIAAAFARGEGDIVGLKHYTLTSRIHRIFDILTSDELSGQDEH
jgi:hypothetical protein